MLWGFCLGKATARRPQKNPHGETTLQAMCHGSTVQAGILCYSVFQTYTGCLVCTVLPALCAMGTDAGIGLLWTRTACVLATGKP